MIFKRNFNNYNLMILSLSWGKSFFIRTGFVPIIVIIISIIIIINIVIIMIIIILCLWAGCVLDGEAVALSVLNANESVNESELNCIRRIPNHDHYCCKNRFPHNHQNHHHLPPARVRGPRVERREELRKRDSTFFRPMNACIYIDVQHQIFM